MQLKVLKAAITALAAGLIVVHVFWPYILIDTTIITLLIVATIPWISNILKSVELPGIGKFEFRDLQKVKDEANKVGLLSKRSAIKKNPQSTGWYVTDEDPNLVLASLRIEIEKRLKLLLKESGISIADKSLKKILADAISAKVISSEEGIVLYDLIRLLNKAVHGIELDQRAVDWALDIGPRVLTTLNNRHLPEFSVPPGK